MFLCDIFTVHYVFFVFLFCLFGYYKHTHTHTHAHQLGSAQESKCSLTNKCQKTARANDYDDRLLHRIKSSSRLMQVTSGQYLEITSTLQLAMSKSSITEMQNV